jgi:UTP--glucose-1-phosphate uridylyltransferase
MEVREIKKAVIPAAGFGTRMLPAAKAIPKEMLPIVDRPTIQCVVEEAARAGLNQIVLINSRGKKATEEHFATNGELERRLTGDKARLLDSLNELSRRISIQSVIQENQRGLGDAVARARDAVGDEAFVCMLGDTVFSGEPSPARQLVEAYRQLGTAIIGLEEVAVEKVSRYGIVGGTVIGEGLLKVERIVEKPAAADAPSRLAVAARYVLTPAIFECLEQTQAGKGGEIQLTDAIALLLKREPVHGVILKARRHDIGNPIDWLKTNLIFAQRDPAMWKQIEPLMRLLLETKGS